MRTPRQGSVSDEIPRSIVGLSRRMLQRLQSEASQNSMDRPCKDLLIMLHSKFASGTSEGPKYGRTSKKLPEKEKLRGILITIS